MIEKKTIGIAHAVPVTVDLRRRITEAAHREGNLGYLSSCLLASIVSHGGSMLVREFPRVMIANENTVVAAAIKLERAGLIERATYPDDRRITVLHAVPRGVSAIERTFAGMYRSLRDEAWAGFDEGEADGIVEAFLMSAPALGISAVECTGAVHDRLPPAFLMVVAAFLRLWSSTVSERFDISLTEYRLLAVLGDARESISCSDLADALVVDRSTISGTVKPLSRKGFLEVRRGADGRQRLVAITDCGAACVRAATEAMERTTTALYPDDSSVRTFNRLAVRLAEAQVAHLASVLH